MTGQGEDFITGCLLDYDYIKNHYRLIAFDLSRQKELDTDSKATQQVELIGQLKKEDGINADAAKSMFALTILEKVKEKRLKFSQGSVTVLQKIANCQEANALTNIAIHNSINNLPGLVSNLTSNAINKFERKINGKGAERAGKGFTLFILNENMNDIIKIIKLVEVLGVLIDGVTETVNYEIKKKQGGGFLGAVSVLLHPLNNIETTNYFNYNPRFNGVFSRNNLPRMKERGYVIDLDDKNSKVIHWVSSFIDRNTAAYFESFGTEYNSLEVLNKSRDKLITHNIFRKQDIESITCEFYCITFIEYMLVRLY